MVRKLATAAVAAAVVSSSVPAAHAAPPAAVGCSHSIALWPVFHAHSSGTLAGYVVGADRTTPVAIRCEIRVGTEVRAAQPASGYQAGTGAAFTAGRVPVTPLTVEDFDVCAVWQHGTDSGEDCAPSATVVPYEVGRLLEALWFVYEEAVLGTRWSLERDACPTLEAWNGTYGPVEIREGTPDPVVGDRGGDVYVNGELVWDCPGYEMPY